MLKILLQECKHFFANIERMFFGKYHPGLIFVEESNSTHHHSFIPEKFSIQEFMGESIVWAVQKHRRTLEKRMSRRFGVLPNLVKFHLPQKDMLVCAHCGHDYKRGYLCKNCYTKVIEETKRIQKRIVEALELKPIDKDVVVLYRGEREDQSSEFWEGKRIVEMPEERPSWFSRNLLQKTTTTTSDNKGVKPEHLG